MTVVVRTKIGRNCYSGHAKSGPDGAANSIWPSPPNAYNEGGLW